MDDLYDDEDQVFVVESIREHRIVDGKDMYLIKWSGYDSDDNTWEPIENLDGCKQLLENFHAGIVDKPKERKYSSKSQIEEEEEDWCDDEDEIEESSSHRHFSSSMKKTEPRNIEKKRYVIHTAKRNRMLLEKEKMTMRQKKHDVYANLGKDQFVDKWAKNRSRIAIEGNRAIGRGTFKIPKKPIYPGKASFELLKAEEEEKAPINTMTSIATDSRLFPALPQGPQNKAAPNWSSISSTVASNEIDNDFEMNDDFAVSADEPEAKKADMAIVAPANEKQNEERFQGMIVSETRHLNQSITEVSSPQKRSYSADWGTSVSSNISQNRKSSADWNSSSRQGSWGDLNNGKPPLFGDKNLRSDHFNSNENKSYISKSSRFGNNGSRETTTKQPYDGNWGVESEKSFSKVNSFDPSQKQKHLQSFSHFPDQPKPHFSRGSSVDNWQGSDDIASVSSSMSPKKAIFSGDWGSSEASSNKNGRLPSFQSSGLAGNIQKSRMSDSSSDRSSSRQREMRPYNSEKPLNYRARASQPSRDWAELNATRNGSRRGDQNDYMPSLKRKTSFDDRGSDISGDSDKSYHRQSLLQQKRYDNSKFNSSHLHEDKRRRSDSVDRNSESENDNRFAFSKGPQSTSIPSDAPSDPRRKTYEGSWGLPAAKFSSNDCRSTDVNSSEKAFTKRGHDAKEQFEENRSHPNFSNTTPGESVYNNTTYKQNDPRVGVQNIAHSSNYAGNWGAPSSSKTPEDQDVLNAETREPPIDQEIGMFSPDYEEDTSRNLSIDFTAENYVKMQNMFNERVNVNEEKLRFSKIVLFEAEGAEGTENFSLTLKQSEGEDYGQVQLPSKMYIENQVNLRIVRQVLLRDDLSKFVYFASSSSQESTLKCQALVNELRDIQKAAIAFSESSSYAMMLIPMTPSSLVALGMNSIRLPRNTSLLGVLFSKEIQKDLWLWNANDPTCINDLSLEDRPISNLFSGQRYGIYGPEEHPEVLELHERMHSLGATRHDKFEPRMIGGYIFVHESVLSQISLIPNLADFKREKRTFFLSFGGNEAPKEIFPAGGILTFTAEALLDHPKSISLLSEIREFIQKKNSTHKEGSWLLKICPKEIEKLNRRVDDVELMEKIRYSVEHITDMISSGLAQVMSNEEIHEAGDDTVFYSMEKIQVQNVFRHRMFICIDAAKRKPFYGGVEVQAVDQFFRICSHKI